VRLKEAFYLLKLVSNFLSLTYSNVSTILIIHKTKKIANI